MRAHGRTNMSSSTAKHPASIHPGLKSLDHINPKLGSMYYRMNQGEPLHYSTPEAFLLWKALPSTQHATENRPFFIFLHDYGSSARVFDKVVAEIRFFSLAIDLRGWGRSDDTRDKTDRAYSVTNMKNQIPHLVDLLQGEKFILVGHGMGGKVAQLYAAGHTPSNFIGLVLLAPAPLSSWRPPHAVIQQYRDAYRHGGDLEQFARDTLVYYLVHTDDLRNFVHDGEKDTPLAKGAWLSYGMGEDFSYGLPRIKVATVIVAAARDKIIPPADVHREVTTRIKTALGFVAFDCGHLMPLEDFNLAGRLTIFTGVAEDMTLGKYVDWRALDWGARSMWLDR